MSVAQVLTDLAQLGIRLEANGDLLRYAPQSAMTPKLLGRLRTHKSELLTSIELFEERAAIMEFDGGLPRAEAERFARILTSNFS